MPDLSPHPSTSAAAMPPPPSPRNQASTSASNGARPGLMKRHSSASASSAGTARHYSKGDSNMFSPGSGHEVHPPQQNPRHHAPKPGVRHARVVLPRNHSSGRNLQRLARNAQNAHAAAEEGRRAHQRARSDDHSESPGGLLSPGTETGEGSARPAGLRRNHTSTQLPRNNSNAKLKKNFSHGQLQRLGGNALGGASTHKSVTSPRLKGKSKRPQSREVQPEEMELDLHQQEVELARQIRERREGNGAQQKKVGFAVGSPGDTSGDSDGPQMEGSGLQEDEWTEESASASPYSTRQNTANNSRRTSMVQERAASRAGSLPEPPPPEANKTTERPEVEIAADVAGDVEADGTPAGSPDSEADSDEETNSPPSPRTVPLEKTDTMETIRPVSASAPEQQSPEQHSPEQRSPTQASRHPQDPTQRLLDRSNHHAAPALVSGINTLGHSSKTGSPAPSTRSGSRDANEEEELVSRFIPSASHPSTGSGANTTTSTPKQSSLHTPEQHEGTAGLIARNRSGPHFQVGSAGAPQSPGSSSTVSGTSTPALGRSRTELKLQQEKALADLETAQERIPVIPAHVYDRRNESLKSYLNLAALHGHEGTSPRGSVPAVLGAQGNLSLGPEVFQGRFRAIGTELRVVQTYRDPIAESAARLRECRDSKLAPKLKGVSPTKAGTAGQQSQLRLTKSAVSLPAQRLREQRGAPSTGSPPTIQQPDPAKKPGLQSARSSVQITNSTNANGKQPARRGVSFAGAPKAAEPEIATATSAPRSASVDDESARPDVVARMMWESVLRGPQQQ